MAVEDGKLAAAAIHKALCGTEAGYERQPSAAEVR